MSAEKTDAGERQSAAPEGSGGRRVAIDEPHVGPLPVEVRSCGGCNPHIDRVAIAGDVVSALLQDGRPANGREASAGGASSAGGRDGPAGGGTRSGRPPTLYLSGCRRACASEHRSRIEDEDAVVVAGEHVDGLPTVADRLVEAVARVLEEITAGTAGAPPGGPAAGTEQSKE
ncbi:MAG: hypothetical protein FJ000_07090 [Actinobacteria bacterium]|nr:hypothetical protein [Actinomycetota bacterium]